MMNKTAVSIRNLVVKRGSISVFRGFDLDIGAGKLVGVLGPSGCGKTTLMRCIVGAQRITSGEVMVLDEPGGTSGLRRRVSYSTQSAAVYDDLTVRQNLDYFGRVLGGTRVDTDRALAAVGLEPQAKQRVATLSGGQRGRVSLAVAMLADPELLVLDEPTVGLDPLLREAIWTVMRELTDAGKTVLVSSHVMDEAMRCDEVILLRDGRLVGHMTPQELLDTTDTTDADAAFLTLIKRDMGDSRRRAS